MAILKVLAIALMMAGGMADAATGKPGKHDPQGNPASFVTPDDYPTEAIRAGQQGRVRVKLAVDEAGKVTGCRVVESSRSPSLDATTCTVALGRMIFEPATDRRGRPVAGSTLIAITWLLPGKYQPTMMPFASTSTVTELVVGKDATVRSCSVRLDGQPLRNVEGQPCDPELVKQNVQEAIDHIAGWREAPDPFLLRSESRLEVEGLPDAPDRLGADMTVLSDLSARFRIGADGKVFNCQAPNPALAALILYLPPCKAGATFLHLSGKAAGKPPGREANGVFIARTSYRRLLPDGV
jgi:TonB family protein